MKGIILVLFFLTNTVCSSVQPRPESDVKAITCLIFNDQRVFTFLDFYIKKSEAIYYRFEEAPMINHSGHPKYQFTVSVGKQYKVKYDSNYKGELEKITIVIEKFSLDGTHASVKIRIPKEGVVGTFRLKKEKSWMIVESSVVEI